MTDESDLDPYDDPEFDFLAGEEPWFDVLTHDHPTFNWYVVLSEDVSHELDEDVDALEEWLPRRLRGVRQAIREDREVILIDGKCTQADIERALLAWLDEVLDRRGLVARKNGE